MTVKIIILSIMWVIMLFIVMKQKTVIKGLVKENHDYWCLWTRAESERNRLYEKEQTRCKIIAGKNETIANLEEQINQKSWQIDKLEDDLAVSHQHCNDLRAELQATHEHYENMYVAELVSI